MWIQTLGTTTDGTTRGLREFKLQIFIVLQMVDIQKEPRRDNNKIETRGKILLGVQRRGKKSEPSVQSPHFLVVTKHFSSLFLRLITGYNISPERFTDIKVSGRADTEAMSRGVERECQVAPLGHAVSSGAGRFSTADQMNLQAKYALAL